LSDLSRRESFVPDAIFEDGEDYAVEAYDGVSLTPKEVAFVDYYVGIARFNATEAYRLANDSRQDVNNMGGKWLRKAHIAKAVKFRLDTIGLSAEAALAELKEVALADFSDLLDVKTRNGEIVSVRLDPTAKVRALELILRAHNRLDNKAAVQAAIVVNINTPGLSEDELA
jgi:phage terminase small subunit